MELVIITIMLLIFIAIGGVFILEKHEAKNRQLDT